MNRHTATDSDGKVHKRNSANRVYSNVVVARSPKPEYYAAHKGADYKAQAWCSRADLAEAQARRDREVYNDVVILEAKLA